MSEACHDSRLGSNALKSLMLRMDELSNNSPAEYELIIERAAIMKEGGYPLLDAHVFMDTEPELYGDIKTLEVFKR